MENFKPILFSTPMVQSILRGEKTKTRRLVKRQPVIDQDSGYKYWDNLMFDIHDDVLESLYMPNHAPYKVGDILWVRETVMPLTKGYMYKADGIHNDKSPAIKWKPSIFMPKDACRIFLRLKSIRVERLDDLSREDAIAEGVEHWYEKFHFCERYKDYTGVTAGFFDQDRVGCSAPEASFRSLWAKLNGFDSMRSNPFVWVYEFELCKNVSFK